MKNILLLFLLFSTTFSFAQNLPKEEFRGVWVATVLNIDFPKQPTTDVALLKEEWQLILNEFKALNFNALIVQIRPAGDAFYPSRLAPWSAYLTGQQGLSPDGNFDLLHYMIETTHDRNMEFHAWLNPYRASMNLKTELFAPTHPFFQHPEWLETYSGKYYFNPALPEVQNHIAEVVEEIVVNYDIDAIHFDDYFYPYKSGGEDFPDEEEYRILGQNFSSKKDFRQQQVTQMIEKVAATIKENKPYVQFGISPFGVWRNKVDDIRGSESRAGVKAFDDLHADILDWLQRGLIDYVAPQLYWNIGFEPADYEKLVYWWSQWRYARHLYIGHAAYKIENNAQEAWYNPEETPKQIRLNRAVHKVHGSAFFSSSKLQNNPLNVLDSLDYYYRMPSKIPEMVWLDVAPCLAPQFDKKIKGDENNVYLKWEEPKEQIGEPYYWMVYRFDGKKEGDYSDVRNVIYMSPFGKSFLNFTDTFTESGQHYTYTITAVNRAHSESIPSKSITILKKKKKIKVLKQ